MRWLCRIGLHKHPRWTPQGFPPMFVLSHCARGCGDPRIHRNYSHPGEPGWEREIGIR